MQTVAVPAMPVGAPPPPAQSAGAAPREPPTPRTPRGGATPQRPPPGTPAASPFGDAFAWRAEVDTLQAQLKSVLDMLQDQGQALAMEAQERCQLAKLLQCEREDRARDVQELQEALEAERTARTRDRRELAEALKAEMEARSSDARGLAKSLQSECNTRAGEVAQLAKVFQAEREARVQEAEELAEALRAELASSDLTAARQPGDGQKTENPASGGACGQAITTQQLEIAELSQRLNELTRFVMSERESHAQAVEEWGRCQQKVSSLPMAMS